MKTLSSLARSLAAVIALALATICKAQPGLPMVAQQVAPRSWMVEGVSALGSAANRNFISNAGFVVTPAGVVVIDALGAPAAAQGLLDEIRKVTPLPVTHVIVTHYHADHIYGLQTFKAQGARILSHQAGRAYLASEAAQLRLQATRSEIAPWIDERTRLVAADVWLDAEYNLDLGGLRFQISPAAPSHTLEDLVV